ncbi:MAG: single-stranded-DNA-specific exonuclease RecJ [Chitinivibrionales bacterium]|nr:single-stranded-DNA-specific exonuclease RecJ [Chitinivibrionales bacterium]
MSTLDMPSEVIHTKKTCPAMVRVLAQEMKLPVTIARLLVGRGIVDPKTAHSFFNISIDQFHDPFRFNDMQRSVERIMRAIGNREKIYIHGDYDVDGVTATVLCIKVLRSLGADCDYFLPNRITEGYGISSDGIDWIAAHHATLIITVDCGITSLQEIEYAARRGIDCIITDHHEVQSKVPAAYSILNPKIASSGYPDKDLAGVGVALKLCQALVKSCGAPHSLWLEYLDIVSLGTAADIVPLVGENRVIARLGFDLLSQTTNIGLQKLIELQGLNGKKLTTQDIVYLIAPCINAAGRLGESCAGVNLLMASNEQDAGRYAQELVAMNTQRRTLDKQVQDTAEKWVVEHCDLQRECAIVAGDSQWHVGVIGIAASRLVEKFSRPVFLFSFCGDGIGRGSGRSIPGVHLLDALKECADLLDSFGGHEAAAGAHIQLKNLDQFRSRFNSAIGSRVRFEQLAPRIFADAEVAIAELTRDFFSLVSSMEPFGPGNNRPVFLCRHLHHNATPRIVGSNHLKLSVHDTNRPMDAIAFNFGNRYSQILHATEFSLAFYLDENVWNGKTSLQMRVKGISM